MPSLLQDTPGVDIVVVVVVVVAVVIIVVHTAVGDTIAIFHLFNTH